MWFSVRYLIEAGQLRELPSDVMEEGCWRKYDDVVGGKIEVEPKSDMRLNRNRSPDLFDWLALAVEGARRRGLQIAKLGNEEEEDRSPQWFLDLAQQQKKLRKEWELNYVP